MTKKTKTSARVRAMKTAGTQHFIERTYREGGAFQWVRETVVNAIEAGATRIEFGVEWQAAESKGVYRRVISDNGKGMRRDELVEFFNTFGGGGKPIGGAAENFGVGSKTSLLPWNTHGVVVISWVDGEGSMVWLQRDSDTGEYGLKYLAAVDDEGQPLIETVVIPFDDPAHGCNWAALQPAWITDHGSVIVLLGNTPSDDTVLGDPSRKEASVFGVAKYLNTRMWEMPEGVEIFVHTFRSDSKSKWPRSEIESRSNDSGRAGARRFVPGALHWIEYQLSAEGQIRDTGRVMLADGTFARWFLWAGARPNVHGYAAENGFVAALYRGELYNFQTHHSVYRALGVSVTSVRQRLWVIFEPPEFDAATQKGAFPTTDRNALKLKGGPNVAEDLPINDWANEFADRMPQPIRNALAEARSNESKTIDDQAWRTRLIERFGSRWKLTRLVATHQGDQTVNAVQPSTEVLNELSPQGTANEASGSAQAKEKPPRAEKTSGPPTIGATPGSTAARSARVGGGLPHCRTVKAEDMEHEGLFAAWQPHDPEFPNGVVLLNVEHPVLLQQIAHYVSHYPDHLGEQVEQEVITVYQEMAVAKVAHSEYLRNVLPSHVVDEQLRSPHALTMGLIGLVGEDSIIAARLGGKFGKTRD